MVSEIRMEAPLRLAPQKRFIRREASQSAFGGGRISFDSDDICGAWPAAAPADIAARPD
jgi:hypothetical protein